MFKKSLLRIFHWHGLSKLLQHLMGKHLLPLWSKHIWHCLRRHRLYLVSLLIAMLTSWLVRHYNDAFAMLFWPCCQKRKQCCRHCNLQTNPSLNLQLLERQRLCFGSALTGEVVFKHSQHGCHCFEFPPHIFHHALHSLVLHKHDALCTILVIVFAIVFSITVHAVTSQQYVNLCTSCFHARTMYHRGMACSVTLDVMWCNEI